MDEWKREVINEMKTFGLWMAKSHDGVEWFLAIRLLKFQHFIHSLPTREQNALILRVCTWLDWNKEVSCGRPKLRKHFKTFPCSIPRDSFPWGATHKENCFELFGSEFSRGEKMPKIPMNMWSWTLFCVDKSFVRIESKISRYFVDAVCFSSISYDLSLAWSWLEKWLKLSVGFACVTVTDTAK